MTHYQARLVPFIALFAAACGGDGESTLQHYADEATQSVDTAEAALSAHHEQVLAETDIGRIHDLEPAHRDTMTMRMGRLQDAIDSMMQCSDHLSTAAHSDTVRSLRDAGAAMDESIDGASAEMKRHFKAMSGAADLNAAQAEEHQHQAAADQIMGSMRTHDEDTAHAMQAMQDDGMSMMCSMASHMHHQL